MLPPSFLDQKKEDEGLIKEIHVKTIKNFLNQVAEAGSCDERETISVDLFGYIVRFNVIDFFEKFGHDKFVNVVKKKLMQYHTEGIPWAEKYHLKIFDEEILLT